MTLKVNRRCVDCNAEPPVSDGQITLMSFQHGWRLTRVIDEQGETVMEWRCRECWARHRQKSGSSEPE